MRTATRRRLAVAAREQDRRWLALLISRDYTTRPLLTAWERETLDRWIASARAARGKES